jgi:hypothetical protein
MAVGIFTAIRSSGFAIVRSCDSFFSKKIRSACFYGATDSLFPEQRNAEAGREIEDDGGSSLFPDLDWVDLVNDAGAVAELQGLHGSIRGIITEATADWWCWAGSANSWTCLFSPRPFLNNTTTKRFT